MFERQAENYWLEHLRAVVVRKSKEGIETVYGKIAGFKY